MVRSTLCTMILVSTLAAAPAPLPKERPLTKKILIGTWEGTWGNTKAIIALYSDGAYTCLWTEDKLYYYGTWDLVKDKISIKEIYNFANSTDPQEIKHTNFILKLDYRENKLTGNTTNAGWIINLRRR